MIEQAIRCKACGAVWSDGGGLEDEGSDGSVERPLPSSRKNQKPLRPNRAQSGTSVSKRKVDPLKMEFQATREVARCQMLSVLPGISPAIAMAILRVYPSFDQLMNADVDSLAHIPVKTATLGHERASVLHRVLH